MYFIASFIPPSSLSLCVTILSSFSLFSLSHTHCLFLFFHLKSVCPVCFYHTNHPPSPFKTHHSDNNESAVGFEPQSGRL
uniref:Putative secreted protein n=1 Tax=Anopheles darlingi TaxID=43151 RepID=A0A2M4DBL7_ANODA